MRSALPQLSLLAAALTVATPAFAWGTDCAFTAERRVDLDAASVAQLELRTGAGDLEVRGEPGLTKVTAVGRACASSQELLDGVQLVRSDTGGHPLVATQMPESDGGWFGDNYAHMDLDVRVPQKIVITLQDSSGDASVTNVNAVDATDSSGDLTIRDIATSVRVDDSSGDVKISQAGVVTISHDSSGDLDINGIGGNVTVDNDSSGDIEIDDVRGNAIVRSDSSGSIEFDRITGNAEVGSDSSGSISATDIGGDFIVRSDGSGGISHDGVAGRVQVPDEDND
jgi:hypothetical protein